MPTLEWIGKSKVINHHQDVPFRVLERKYSFDENGQHNEDNGSENMIIRGDNLEALKALLPRYEGRVKCIYIDPPYNTGNEGWVYNDNVNDPKIKKWLGEVVGKEGEDLTRHDKWLCMMYPRLKLLQKLLADDGVIFISIDDTEYANLKLICDEIFGSNCFVSNISWQRTYSTRNDSKGIVNEVEHLVVYSKQPDWNPNKLPRTAEMDAKYKNPDNDHTLWRMSDAFAPGAATHQGMVYAIQHPFTGKMLYPYNGSCWRYQQDQMLEIMRGWCEYELRDLNDAHERAVVCGVPESDVRQGVQAIVLSESLEISAQKAQAVYDRGQWPRFFFTKGGKGGIARKTYLENVGGKLPTNFWAFTETGHTDEAKKEMLAIFDGKATFDTPKPHRLIEFVLKVAGNENTLVLDSFAGSGTTAHAVLNMNKADGGHRKFIMVQLPEKCDESSEAYKAGYKTICEIGKERIRRAGEKIQEARLEAIALSKHEWDQTCYYVEHQKECDRLGHLPDEYFEKEHPPIDTGFRVLKLDDTNMKDVYYAPDDYDQGMIAALESNIKDDRTDLDLLFGCLIDWGLPLSLPYKSEQLGGCTVHTYNDGDLIACFDANIPESVVKEIAQRKPLRAVFRDSGFASSPEKINVFEIFKLYMPEDANDISKRVRVI